MIKQILFLAIASLGLVFGVIGCAGGGSAQDNPPIRPTGSGGRGMSPGQAAHTQ